MEIKEALNRLRQNGGKMKLPSWQDGEFLFYENGLVWFSKDPTKAYTFNEFKILTDTWIVYDEKDLLDDRLKELHQIHLHHLSERIKALEDRPYYKICETKL